MNENFIFQRRNRLKKHFVNTSTVLLYCYEKLSDAAKVTFQVVDSFDWESKETQDSKGYVFPAVTTIARLRHSSERTIRRHILELIEIQLLTRIRKRNKPSILFIEEVSEKEAQKYFALIQPSIALRSYQNTDDTIKSRTDNNDRSDNPGERTIMTVAYKDKKDEIKENEINVNEDFNSFKSGESEERIKKENRGGDTRSLRDILIHYDLNIPRKASIEASLNRKTKSNVNKNQRDYLASEMADKLSDPKSLGCFRVIAEKVPQQVIFEVLSSIKETAMEGKIKVSRGALFVNIIQGYCESSGIDLGFKNEAETSPLMQYNG